MTENEFAAIWRDSVAAALRMALAEADMNRAGLSRASGIHENTLGRYFQGTRDIPANVLFDIAPHMDTSMSKIFAVAESILEKRTNMSWDEHVLAAKRGYLDPPEQ